jgi:hypothetical protein
MTLPHSITFSDLTSHEQEAIASLQTECSNLFSRRCSETSSNISLQTILRKIHQFIHSDDIEAQARRADACGILWISKGIVLNTSRLRGLLGKGRSWINEHFTRLGYVPAGPESQLEVALELTRILGRGRYDAKKSAHWTCRSPKVPGEGIEFEEVDRLGKDDSWGSEIEDVIPYDTWGFV